MCSLNPRWLGNATGWVGDRHWSGHGGAKRPAAAGVFSAQHGWAMQAGVYDGAAAALNRSLRSLDAHCRQGWNYGYAYICGPLEPPPRHALPRVPPRAAAQQPEARQASSDDDDASDAGASPRGHRRRLQFSDAPGMWPAVNGPTILGLLAVNRTEAAWTEFVRNTLQWQATQTPATWIGIWTSADSVNNDGMPSDWTNNFPAFCMHRHAWPLFSLRQLTGLHFTADGILVRTPDGKKRQCNHKCPLFCSTRPARWVILHCAYVSCFGTKYHIVSCFVFVLCCVVFACACVCVP